MVSQESLAPGRNVPEVWHWDSLDNDLFLGNDCAGDFHSQVYGSRNGAVVHPYWCRTVPTLSRRGQACLEHSCLVQNIKVSVQARIKTS